MDETHALEALTREMAALTDALSRLHHSMNATAVETLRLDRPGINNVG